jgi:hypothetical protein
MQDSISSMDECNGVCIQEKAGIQQFSSPVVGDDELVCRTVRPEDYSSKGVLKPSFIQTTRLKAGELSAWRLNQPTELPNLEDKLAKSGLPAHNILAARASDLRQIRLGGARRGISIVNDTRVDDIGGHDPMHVALAPCAQLLEDPEEIDEVVADLKTRLMTTFRSSGIALKPMGQAGT